MADVASPSGAAMFDGGAEHKKEKHHEKHEKPVQIDKAVYEANLAKAQKEHADVQAKFVST